MPGACAGRTSGTNVITSSTARLPVARVSTHMVGDPRQLVHIPGTRSLPRAATCSTALGPARMRVIARRHPPHDSSVSLSRSSGRARQSQPRSPHTAGSIRRVLASPSNSASLPVGSCASSAAAARTRSDGESRVGTQTRPPPASRGGAAARRRPAVPPACRRGRVHVLDVGASGGTVTRAAAPRSADGVVDRRQRSGQDGRSSGHATSCAQS